jgi:hypothetical protein
MKNNVLFVSTPLQLISSLEYCKYKKIFSNDIEILISLPNRKVDFKYKTILKIYGLNSDNVKITYKNKMVKEMDFHLIFYVLKNFIKFKGRVLIAEQRDLGFFISAKLLKNVVIVTDGAISIHNYKGKWLVLDRFKGYSRIIFKGLMVAVQSLSLLAGRRYQERKVNFFHGPKEKNELIGLPYLKGYIQSRDSGNIKNLGWIIGQPLSEERLISLEDELNIYKVLFDQLKKLSSPVYIKHRRDSKEKIALLSDANIPVIENSDSIEVYCINFQPKLVASACSTALFTVNMLVENVKFYYVDIAETFMKKHARYDEYKDVYRYIENHHSNWIKKSV